MRGLFSYRAWIASCAATKARRSSPAGTAARRAAAHQWRDSCSPAGRAERVGEQIEQAGAHPRPRLGIARHVGQRRLQGQDVGRQTPYPVGGRVGADAVGVFPDDLFPESEVGAAQRRSTSIRMRSSPSAAGRAPDAPPARSPIRPRASRLSVGTTSMSCSLINSPQALRAASKAATTCRELGMFFPNSRAEM